MMNRKILSQTLNNYIYDNITYMAYSHKEIKKMFLLWKNSLSLREKTALILYRTNNFLKINTNAKLRKGQISRNAQVISSALKKAVLSDNIIVYRRLANGENAYMQSLKEKDIYLCKDFKGTHVGTLIKEKRQNGISAGYMFILIPRNSHVAYINDVTLYSKNERELLIDKNQYYQLIKKFDFWNRNGYLVKLINVPNIS